MFLESERRRVAEFGRRMSAEGLSNGTSGNLSVYVPEEGYMVLSPSGMRYEDIHPEDVVVLTLEGKPVDGERKPSSEWALHAYLYREKPEIRGVVHTERAHPGGTLRHRRSRDGRDPLRPLLHLRYGGAGGTRGALLRAGERGPAGEPRRGLLRGEPGEGLCPRGGPGVYGPASVPGPLYRDAPGADGGRDGRGAGALPDLRPAAEEVKTV